MGWQENLEDIRINVEETKETTAQMTDAELVRGGAVVLEELISLQEEYNYILAEWKVWWAEAARRNLLSDILDKRAEGRAGNG